MFKRFLRQLQHRSRPACPACECNWFEMAAKDESIPVVFDEQMNEYHLTHGGGYSLFYYCPFCGGKAPESLRGTYWTEVSQEEALRLELLMKEIKTPEQLFSTFGDPDEDYPVGGSFTSRGTEGEPPETKMHARRVVYRSLSDTVDVHVSIDRYDRLRFSYQGRYIGPKRNRKETEPDS